MVNSGLVLAQVSHPLAMPNQIIKSKKKINFTRNSTPNKVDVLQQEVDRLNKELGQQKQKTIAAKGHLDRILGKVKPLHEMHKVLSESLQSLENTAEVRGIIQYIMDLLHEVEGGVAAAEEDGC